MNRLEEAKVYSAAGRQRAKENPAPPQQKFPTGTRVRIADDLGPMMRHFPAGKNATVVASYAQQFGGDNFQSYTVDIDGEGEVSWYEEHQLAPIS